MIVETLKEADDRYKLTAPVKFYSKNVTLRTTQDRSWNANGFTTTIVRDFETTGSMFQVTNGSFTVENIALDGNNQSATGQDGGILNAQNATLTIKDGATLTKGKGRNGGAIYMNGGTLNIEKENTASESAKLTDSSAENGGAIYVNGGTLNMSDGKITGNKATKTATGDGYNALGGGGVYMNGGTLTMTGGEITDNSAILSGGGILGNGAALNISGRNTIIGKSDGANKAKDGGGICLFPQSGTDTGSTLNLTNAKVQYNTATRDGGGILAKSKGAVTISGANTSIAHNEAANGGGVSVDGTCALQMSNGSLAYNTATNYGGGFRAQGTGNVLFSGTTIRKNTAQYGAGGAAVNVQLQKGVRVQNNTLSGNDPNNGAGLYIEGTLSLGGVDLDSAHIDSETSSVTGNKTSNGNPSNVRLPYSNEVNGQRSIALLSNFAGTIGVCNPGLVYTQFGVSDPTKQDAAYTGAEKIASDDGEYVGRIDDSGFSDSTYETAAYRLIWWKDPVCKITNASGALLSYTRGNVHGAAIFARLVDAVTAYQGGTFKTLNSQTAATPAEIRMIVPAYEMSVPLTGNAAITSSMTITTETRTSSTVKFPYPSDAASPPCTIKSNVNATLASVNGAEVTLKNIVFDGDAQANSSATRKLFSVSGANGKLILSEDAKLQNTRAGNSQKGAAVEVGANAELIMERNAEIRYCNAPGGGGAVYLADGAKLTMRAGTGTGKMNPSIHHCESGENGGAVLADYSASQNSVISLSGGAQIYDCEAATSGGAIYMGAAEGTGTAGKLEIIDAQIRDNTVTGTTGQGGAIYVKRGKMSALNAKLQRNSAADGGAVYVAEGATMDLSNGENPGQAVTQSSQIKGNSATKNGAGIYLESGATLKLAGSPYFGGADLYPSGAIKGTDGNFVKKTSGFKTGTDEPTNGGKAYVKDSSGDYKVRQDIFIAGYETAGSAATSLVVSGALNVDAGSIWVWAEKQEHYEMLKQFAVFETEAVKNSLSATQLEAVYNAFRNAQPDAVTGCGGDYLTGQEGDDINNRKCICWTGGFDFAFKKIDGDGNALNGATFTLYMSAKDSNNNDVPAKLEGNVYKPAGATDTLAAYKQLRSGASEKVDATATSGSGTATNSNAGKNAANAVTIKVTTNNGTTVNPVDLYGDGLVVFEKIPPGVYFLKETTSPTVDGKTYAAVEEMYKIDLNPKGYYTIYVAGRDASGNPVWTAAVPAPTTKFVKGTDEKYAMPTGTIAQDANTVDIYTVMNVDARTGRVILKKVNADNVPLSGARFKVYRADMTEIKNADYKSDGYYESLASGVFFIGDLPYGTYYLHETYVPSGYEKLTTTNDNWFILTVNENGAGKLTSTNMIGNRIERQQTAP